MLKQKTVLAVDDDCIMLCVVEEALNHAGYQVRAAADGLQALRAAEQSVPDLILLDLSMPVMDGSTFAHEFKAKYKAEIPIVLLSGELDIKRRAEELGAASWISKPFDIETLVCTVDRFLR